MTPIEETVNPLHHRYKGRWRDRVYSEDGSYRYRYYNMQTKQWEWDDLLWACNLIVDKIAPLISGLMRGESTFSADPNIYFAVGSGNAGWDVLGDRGKSNENVANTQLVTEVFRKKLTDPSDFSYLDANDVVQATPQAKLEYRGRLLAGEAQFELREFGLFGGDASATADTGFMLDHVIHAKIDRTVLNPQLDRLIRITY